MEKALVLLRREYDQAAFVDDFERASVLAVAHQQLDARRQALWWAAADCELALFEVRRQEECALLET